MLATLAFYSSYGGGVIGDVLYRWEQAGVFSYVLPFLLIFALVFGTLSVLKLFGEQSKGLNVVIALAVALMSLQFDFVPLFFAQLFPRLGVGLAVILAIMILMGLFAMGSGKDAGTMQKWFRVMMIFIILVTFVIIILNSTDAFGWYSGFGFQYWLRYNWPTVLGIVIFLGALIAIVSSTRGGPKGQPIGFLSHI